MTMEPLLYGIDALVRLTGVSRSRLYIEMDAGNLRWVKVGRKRLVRAGDLAEWLNSLGNDLTDNDRRLQQFRKKKLA